MPNKHWVGELKGARYGPLYWTEDGEGAGEFSATTSDGKALAFSTASDSSTPNRIRLFTKDSGSGNAVLVGGMSFEIRAAKQCSGTWDLLDGSKGIFDLALAERPSESPSLSAQSPAPQLWNKEALLGAVTLYRADLERLIAELETFVPAPATTYIRATEGGQVIVHQADAYLARRDRPDIIKDMSIVREEIVSTGFKKIATVNLNDSGENNISVSSPDELWTSAVSQRLESFMGQFTSVFTGILRKHGLNINSLILLCVLIVIPDYKINTRIFIAIGAILIILAIAGSHKFIRFARVYLDPDRPKNPYSKEVPSAIMALIATVIATGFSTLPQILDMLRKAAEAVLSFWTS
ncbi:hypothetical protein [Sphingobium terrigena]|uniref:hypothetical protein n=1 Tax=Sphingobium terrigena TaxID=2304063 RepID=UPI0011C492E8|nr:hypothetical protein [Sphingobium terrigena]